LAVVERSALDLVEATDAIGYATVSGWPVGTGEPPRSGIVCYGRHVPRSRFPAKLMPRPTKRTRHG
jgi:hypothetical protein